MSSNYPPGVTGNEWEIAGYPPCGRTGCGHNDEDHVAIGGVGGIEETLGACEVDGCLCEEYTPYKDEYDYIEPPEPTFGDIANEAGSPFSETNPALNRGRP